MNEMTFQIRTEGDSCLYEQIYGHIKGEIRSGKLLSGEDRLVGYSEHQL